MKLGCQQRDLLIEAARRYLMFNYNSAPVTESWTGLGSATIYAPVVNAGLMTAVHELHPGTSIWWKLTNKGASIVQSLLDDGLKLSDFVHWDCPTADQRFDKLALTNRVQRDRVCWGINAPVIM